MPNSRLLNRQQEKNPNLSQQHTEQSDKKQEEIVSKITLPPITRHAVTYPQSKTNTPFFSKKLDSQKKISFLVNRSGKQTLPYLDSASNSFKKHQGIVPRSIKRPSVLVDINKTGKKNEKITAEKKSVMPAKNMTIKDDIMEERITKMTLAIEAEKRRAFYDPTLDARLQKYIETYPERFEAIQNLKHTVTDAKSIGSKDEYSSFINRYSRESWTFCYNVKTELSPFYASDVVIEQYMKMAKNNDYYGWLPKEIIHNLIINKITMDYMDRQRANGDVTSQACMDNFLNDTPNGKRTKRVLEAFGLKADSIIFWSDCYNITLKVSPIEPVPNSV